MIFGKHRRIVVCGLYSDPIAISVVPTELLCSLLFFFFFFVYYTFRYSAIIDSPGGKFNS